MMWASGQAGTTGNLDLPGVTTVGSVAPLVPGRAVAAIAARRYVARFSHLFPTAPVREGLFLGALARHVLEWLSRTNAPYHDLEHSLAVAEVATIILDGRVHAGEALTSSDWLHATAAALLHDIGYVHGVCRDDGPGLAATAPGQIERMPRGASDAWLGPAHIHRGAIFVRERLTETPLLDADRLVRAIQFTSFPVPNDPAHARDDHEPGLMRAADLIGQLADPGYPRKLPALFAEFAENGEAARIGYACADDIWHGFPAFFDSQVAPHIGPARRYLSLTADGRRWLAGLAHNVARARLDARSRGGITA